MASAEVRRKRRHDAATRGLCSTCTYRKPEPGFKVCKPCRDNAARAKVRSKARAAGFDSSGWCGECLASWFHRIDCLVIRLRDEQRRAA